MERAEAGFDIELHVLVMDRLSEHFLLGCEPDHAQLGVGGRKGRGKGREEDEVGGGYIGNKQNCVCSSSTKGIKSPVAPMIRPGLGPSSKHRCPCILALIARRVASLM